MAYGCCLMSLYRYARCFPHYRGDGFCHEGYDDDHYYDRYVHDEVCLVHYSALQALLLWPLPVSQRIGSQSL
ncbi:Uncharacterised protein [Vibrio cholerae]|uniref:Uncharacterized protein n=1 Tax=Vibrio cholerae TaxID=666 RepID=A0A655YRF8_VIBCL|nr:Uncharacterised protein [Vibrio cholerae]CSC48454.1 Uncharacterised protein [Vibrio cholerae]CSD12932.1 Uncharacterised protein [Vibrio cholerae]